MIVNTQCAADIHMGNVLFQLPDPDHSSSQTIMEEYGAPDRGTVSRKDGKPLTKGVPEYLVEPVEYEHKDVKHLRDIKLIDFGECASFLSRTLVQIG